MESWKYNNNSELNYARELKNTETGFFLLHKYVITLKIVRKLRIS